MNIGGFNLLPKITGQWKRSGSDRSPGFGINEAKAILSSIVNGCIYALIVNRIPKISRIKNVNLI
jgi:hypothetical protein